MDGQRLPAVAERLRVTREKVLELKPVDVCRKIGVRASTYSNWEKGTKRPNLDDMMRLCAAYGLTLDWIYRGDPSALPAHLQKKLPPV